MTSFEAPALATITPTTSSSSSSSRRRRCHQNIVIIIVVCFFFPYLHLTLPQVVVGKIRSTVAQRLWQLIVVEADLPKMLQKLKEYFLLANGNFYEQFVGEARQLMLVPPNMANAEADIIAIFQQAASKVRRTSCPTWLF